MECSCTSGAGEGGGGNAVTRSHYCTAILHGPTPETPSHGVFCWCLDQLQVCEYDGAAVHYCIAIALPAAGPGVTQHCPCH